MIVRKSSQNQVYAIYHLTISINISLVRNIIEYARGSSRSSKTRDELYKYLLIILQKKTYNAVEIGVLDLVVVFLNNQPGGKGVQIFNDIILTQLESVHDHNLYKIRLAAADLHRSSMLSNESLSRLLKLKQKGFDDNYKILKQQLKQEYDLMSQKCCMHHDEYAPQLILLLRLFFIHHTKYFLTRLLVYQTPTPLTSVGIDPSPPLCLHEDKSICNHRISLSINCCKNLAANI